MYMHQSTHTHTCDKQYNFMVKCECECDIAMADRRVSLSEGFLLWLITDIAMLNQPATLKQNLCGTVHSQSSTACM